MLAIVAAKAMRGGALPLAINYKTGPGGYLLIAPFVLAFGETLRALRVASVFWGAACVAATGVLAERCSGSRRAGVLAACVAAVTPALSAWMPMGMYAHIPNTALVAAALAEMIACARDRSPRRARLAGLLLGLALATHSVAAGIVVGLVVFALLNRERFGPSERRLVGQGAAFFAAPLLPYLWALSVGGLWRYWPMHLIVRDDDHRLSNLAYFPSLLVRARQLFCIAAPSVGWGAPSRALLSAAGAACAAGLLGAALWAFVRVEPRARGAARFLWTLCACFFLLSPFTPSRLHAPHLLMAMPVLWAAVAASLALEVSGLARRTGVLLVCAYLAAGGAVTVFKVRSEARDGDAGGDDALAIVDMGRYFAARPELAPAIVTDSDEFGAMMIRFLSGRVPPVLKTGSSTPAGDAEWKTALGNPGSVFVVPVSDSEEPDHEEPARRRAARDGYSLVETDVLRDGLGAPAYRLLAARSR